MPPQMQDWIDYYDSAHAIYVSEAHRKAHFEIIARDIIGYIQSPDTVVIDYSCGEALEAGSVAAASKQLILAEPAPSIRDRLSTRYASNPKIKVTSLDDLAELPAASVDLVVMISVAQYMNPADLDATFAVIRRLLKPRGRLILGDILDPNVGASADVKALLRFAAQHGFLLDAVIGVGRIALSNYRRLRQTLGLQHYTEAEMLAKLKAAGFDAARVPVNVGYNPARMTFIASDIL